MVVVRAITPVSAGWQVCTNTVALANYVFELGTCILNISLFSSSVLGIMSAYAQNAHSRSPEGDNTISGRRSYPNHQYDGAYGAHPATTSGYDGRAEQVDDAEALYAAYYDDAPTSRMFSSLILSHS